MAELREMNLQEVGRLFGVEVSESETYIFLWAHQDYGARGMMLGLSVPSQWFNWRGVFMSSTITSGGKCNTSISTASHLGNFSGFILSKTR